MPIFGQHIAGGSGFGVQDALQHGPLRTYYLRCRPAHFTILSAATRGVGALALGPATLPGRPHKEGEGITHMS